MSTLAATAPSVQEETSKPSVHEVQLQTELEAARARIRELEAKVLTLESQSRKREAEATAPASSKKVKITPVTPAAPTANRRKLICKKLQQTIKNSLKGVKFFSGHDATDRNVNATDVLSMEEFQTIFGNHGKLIQPTPENKPTSTVHIRTLSESDLSAILGTSHFKAELWTKGGAPTYGGGGFGFFGGFSGRGGGGFSKSNKIKGGCNAVLRSAEVKFSSNNGKLLMKCTFSNRSSFYNGMESDEGDY